MTATTMRTGTEYRDALRAGRKVWVLGEGPIEDVVLTPADANGHHVPWAFILPKGPEDLRGMGRFYCVRQSHRAGRHRC
jgi:aromatic ring hydroxylase